MELDQIYEQHSRQVLATLIRLTGEFELAEECLQEAFAAALSQWPAEGVPDNPVAWLVRTGHHKAIDHIRRQQTARRHSEQLIPETELAPEQGVAIYEDDLLRLIFTCCHPALGREAQLALTLREVCGLTTEQVAHALLQKPATLAQRIVRAKRKIREAGIPYEVPDQRALPERPAAGLSLLDQLAGDKALQGYHLYHAARADLYRRSGDWTRARQAYRQALTLTRQEPERRFLRRRLNALPPS